MTVGVCQTTFLDYDGFIKKFEAKKTTDDCYTPPAVYEAVVNWCRVNCGLKPDTQIIRPFWPGGDYERQVYPPGAVVIDNPPFSICKKIIDFYLDKNIKFFLFVPGLTCFWPSLLDACLVIVHKTIEYENGARVCTAFCTNLLPHRLVLSGSLSQALAACQPSKAKPPHPLPPNTFSAGTIKKFTPKDGTDLYFSKDEAAPFIRGKTYSFGTTTLTSEAAARLRGGGRSEDGEGGEGEP